MSKNALRLFLSYSHDDDKLRSELSAHLAPLRHQGLIVEWTDRQVSAGSQWEKEILGSLDEADLIVLLVSSDFLNSGYCVGVEMERALARHASGTACVVPVIARPCHWERIPSLASLQVLPKGAEPITRWTDRDSAYLSVVQGIEDAARRILLDSPTIVTEWVSSLLGRRKVVRSVQTFLKNQGWYRGPVDGEPANMHLRDAVRQFQQQAGLDPDGLIGPKTLRVMSAQVNFNVIPH